MLMLVMLVGGLLSAGLMPVLASMQTTANYDVTRVRDLNAAQAGADVVIGKIRQAVDTSGGGDPTQLPCTNNAAQTVDVPFTGTVANGGTDIAYYSVTVKYYVTDPILHPTATPMRCVPGKGTYYKDASSGTELVVPSFAKIKSTGTDASTNVAGSSTGRTVTSVYSFEVDNQNISGGIIPVYPDSSDSDNLSCLDVGSGTPTAGVTAVYLQKCSTAFPPADQQTFAYRTDLTLQLVSSIGTTVSGVTYKSGLCIDIKNFTNSSTTPAAASPLVLQQCGALGSPVWSQQWSFDNYSSLQAPVSNSASSGTLSGYCMTVTSPHTAGQLVKLQTCDSTITSPYDAWQPSPAVGAGAAFSSPDTYNSAIQWINFEQFGRCINDPGDNPGYGFIIVASCKQNPKASAVPTNQKYTYNTTTQQLINVSSNKNYCLTSPTSAPDASITTADLVTLTLCSATSTAQRWTRTTPKSSPGTPYSQQYRFVSAANGGCMSLASLTAPNDTAYARWSKLITATCDGSTRQQWNASNSVGDPSIQNVREG